MLVLRSLMGYPLFEPTRHTLSFCTSGPRDVDDILHLTQLASEMQKDLLHLTFAELDDQEPCAVSLVVHQPLCVEWMPDCRLFAANEEAPVGLLQGARRWRFDERNQLVSCKLPPRHLLARGEQTAWARWRKETEQMDGIALQGNKFVHQGQALAEALPIEAIRVTS